jgi:hypothetical protein
MKLFESGFASAFLVSILLMCACGDVKNTTGAHQLPQISQAPLLDSSTQPNTAMELQSAETESKDADLSANTDEDKDMLQIEIGDTTLTAVLEENPSAEAFKNLLVDGPITIEVQNYGGFEKVGTLPQSLTQNDTQITAMPGDIMLYQGNSIVFFYGTNTWAYTKLGTITGFSGEELSEILGGNATTVELSIANPAKSY